MRTFAYGEARDGGTRIFRENRTRFVITLGLYRDREIPMALRDVARAVALRTCSARRSRIIRVHGPQSASDFHQRPACAVVHATAQYIALVTRRAPQHPLSRTRRALRCEPVLATTIRRFRDTFLPQNPALVPGRRTAAGNDLHDRGQIIPQIAGDASNPPMRRTRRPLCRETVHTVADVRGTDFRVRRTLRRLQKEPSLTKHAPIFRRGAVRKLCGFSEMAFTRWKAGPVHSRELVARVALPAFREHRTGEEIDGIHKRPAASAVDGIAGGVGVGVGGVFRPAIAGRVGSVVLEGAGGEMGAIAVGKGETVVPFPAGFHVRADALGRANAAGRIFSMGLLAMTMAPMHLPAMGTMAVTPMSLPPMTMSLPPMSLLDRRHAPMEMTLLPPPMDTRYHLSPPASAHLRRNSVRTERPRPTSSSPPIQLEAILTAHALPRPASRTSMPRRRDSVQTMALPPRAQGGVLCDEYGGKQLVRTVSMGTGELSYMSHSLQGAKLWVH